MLINHLTGLKCAVTRGWIFYSAARGVNPGENRHSVTLEVVCLQPIYCVMCGVLLFPELLGHSASTRGRVILMWFILGPGLL